MDKGLKVVIIILSVILVLAAGLLCSMLVLQDNYLIDWRIYPKDAQMLDLRGKKISPEHYENIRQKLPNCEIIWDVPFQEGVCPSNATEVTLSTLTDADVALLDYVPGLTRVDATACRDYAQLLDLRERHPGCRIDCNVTIDGREYASDTTEISVKTLTEGDLALLPLLADLKAVDARGCQNYDKLIALQEQFPECHVTFDLILGEDTYPSDSRELTLEKAVLSELLEKLPAMPALETVMLLDPQGEPGELAQLCGAMPDTAFVWEKELLGARIRSDAQEADFSGATGFTLEQVEEAMTWFPEVKTVFLGACGIDNETVAAFREEKQEAYKVVWTVDCGSLSIRTDEKSFIPIKHHVYYFFDKDCVNLRYCNEMEALDIGHMSIHDVSFLEGMTSLKYLILAHTFITDITPISNCKNLVFLEIDHTAVADFTPLQGCTSLEDLNIGDTYADVEPLLEMTWLKNLWCVKRGYGSFTKLEEGLPDTHVNYAGGDTVGNGWRKLPNYYAMRDALGMYYM